MAAAHAWLSPLLKNLEICQSVNPPVYPEERNCPQNRTQQQEK